MKVKFCGMTNYEDVKDAIDLGVDFVGFVFYKKSKRFIKPEDAKAIAKKVKGNVNLVGVFFGFDRNRTLEIFEFCDLDYAQVYEPLDGIPTITVYRIKEDIPKVKQNGLILFDIYTETGGGSGKSFDWRLLDKVPFKDRLIVAGGVNKNNVIELIERGVYGIDLVSSIEKYPGKKSKRKMEEFMKVVRGER